MLFNSAETLTSQKFPKRLQKGYIRCFLKGTPLNSNKSFNGMQTETVMVLCFKCGYPVQLLTVFKALLFCRIFWNQIYIKFINFIVAVHTV